MFASVAVLAMVQPFAPVAASSTWIASSLRRFYPRSAAESDAPFQLEMARGERSSFQAVVRTGDAAERLSGAVIAPRGIEVLIRRVGYVPLKHFNTDTPEDERDGNGFVPGLAPDPLLPESSFEAPPNEAHAFWITVAVGKNVKPGAVSVQVRTQTGDRPPETRAVRLVVHPSFVPPRRDFPVTQWFYADALCDFYHLKPFEPRFWSVLKSYVDNVVSHGQNMLYVPMLTPSTDGVKRPTQLLRITRDGEHYNFDWSNVKRWVDLAKSSGIEYFEWSHLFTQWGCKNAVRIYEGDIAKENLLLPANTPATAKTYRNFLGQLLPQLHEFVVKEGIEKTSYFHISDEPSGEEALSNYRAARSMVRSIAPWMRMMDAMSELQFAKEGLIDVPVPILNTAPDFIHAGYDAWAYFCGGPRGRYLNRLMDTPLPKIRMTGWLLYRLGAHGFLHWGYNYWYKSQTRTMIDPFNEQSGDAWPGWAYGDTFVVYPGPNGPIDSIRWEVFAESLRDYALLQAARIPTGDPLLADLHDYADFPKSEKWIAEARHAALVRLDRLQSMSKSTKA